jgi:hypothetical protein
VTVSGLRIGRFYLDLLVESVNRVEEALASELAMIERTIEKQAAGLPADQANEVYDAHHDRHWLLRSAAPEHVRLWSFVAAYAAFEDTLAQVCRQAQNADSLTVSLEDIKGLGVEQARRYIKVVLGVAFPDDTPEWSKLKDLQTLRNRIVHYGGRFDTRSIEHMERVQRLSVHKGFKVDMTGHVILEPEFFISAVAVMGSVLDALGAAAPTL